MRWLRPSGNPEKSQRLPESLWSGVVSREDRPLPGPLTKNRAGFCRLISYRGNLDPVTSMEVIMDFENMCFPLLHQTVTVTLIRRRSRGMADRIIRMEDGRIMTEKK